MADYDKAALDEMTDGAVSVLREVELMPLHQQYARLVSGYLAVQFPGAPELPRIVLTCAQMMAALGAEGVSGAVVVAILGDTGIRLLDGEPG